MSVKRIGIMIVVLTLAAVGVVWIVVATKSDHLVSNPSAKLPTCQASRIVVSLGPNMKPSSKFPLAVELVPVFLKNDGPACHLRLGSPVAQAIVGSAPLRSVKQSELSFPALMSPSVGIVNIERGRQSEALFEVWKVPVSSGQSVEACTPMIASRLSIGGYALPIGSQRVFARSLFGVCFGSGGATPTVNTEIIWLKLSH